MGGAQTPWPQSGWNVAQAVPCTATTVMAGLVHQRLLSLVWQSPQSMFCCHFPAQPAPSGLAAQLPWFEVR